MNMIPGYRNTGSGAVRPAAPNPAAAVAVAAAVAPDDSTARVVWPSVWYDLVQLTRPRIAVMVLATVAAAVWLTQAETPAARLLSGEVVLGGGRLAWLLVGTALVAASSSIANQIVERSTDRRMDRTARRPLAAGRLGVATATWLAGVLLVCGAGVATAAAGWPAAAAAVATWLLYVLVYTPLKRVTPLNTAVGAVAGALPVAIGWLAAAGPARLAAGDARGGLAVAALFTILYLWQFPHFMAIAWLYRRQYAAAGLQMLPVVDPSGLRAAGQALAASLALVPAALVLAVPSGSIRLFLAAAVAAVTYACVTVHFAIRRDDVSARRLLLTSLGVLLGLLVAAVTLA